MKNIRDQRANKLVHYKQINYCKLFIALFHFVKKGPVDNLGNLTELSA